MPPPEASAFQDEAGRKGAEGGDQLAILLLVSVHPLLPVERQAERERRQSHASAATPRRLLLRQLRRPEAEEASQEEVFPKGAEGSRPMGAVAALAAAVGERWSKEGKCRQTRDEDWEERR